MATATKTSVRLVCDGTGRNAKLYDADGEEISLKFCQSLTYNVVGSNKPATLTATWALAGVDVMAEMEVVR